MDPMCATLGRGAPRVPGADSPRAPRAPGVPHTPAVPGAPHSGHVQIVRCACARGSTHREACRPPPLLSNSAHHCLVGLRTAGHTPPPSYPCQKPLDSDRGVA
eukprot:1706263-Pyramimonas_sp.AAC.1